jgi:hypothetical protein
MRKYYYILLILTLVVFTQCEDSDYSTNDSNDTGTAGSLARFGIAGNYLYTVELEYLKIFDITNETQPVFVKQLYIDFGIETIFAKDQYLFLGSRWGVYIYDISIPENPVRLSLFSHIYSCDPVVVSGNYAYATLNSAGRCGRGLNQLSIIDVSDKTYPVEVSVVNMDSPKGLGVSSNLLFVCDNGIKVFDITDPVSPIFIRKVSVNAFDVIPIDTILIVVAESGLYEYEFDSTGELTLLSTLYSNN